MKTHISAVAACACALTLPGLSAEEQGKFLGTTWQEWPDPLLGTLFNQVTTENCGKWGLVEPKRGERKWTPVDAMLALAEKHGMQTKYHCLVWGMQQPKWTETADDMKAAVDGFIADYFARYAGKVHMLDVLNEPISQPAKYREQLGGAGDSGWDWVVWVFSRARHHARANNCKAKLILNEWGLLANDAKLKRFCEIVALLQKDGLIDAIGAQGHFLEGAGFSHVRTRLDRLAEAGLPIYISEFDIDIADDKEHAERFSNLFRVFWEHPAVKGVTVWGHREGRIWRKNAFLVRKDGSERPALTWLKGYLAESESERDN